MLSPSCPRSTSRRWARSARPSLNRLEARDVPAFYTVTGSGDVGGLAPTGGTGTDIDPFLVDDFRSAIQLADANPGADTITFKIAGAPGTVHKIALTQGLPGIPGETKVDATTQPGYAGKPLVELDGSATAGAFGIGIFGAKIEVRGFALTNFSSLSILVAGKFVENSQVAACHINTDSAGISVVGNNSFNTVGIFDGVTSFTLGGPNPGDRNVIAADLSGGFNPGVFTGTSAIGGVNGITIQNNYFGIGADGSSRVTVPGGSFSPAIFLQGASNSTIRDNVIGYFNFAAMFVQAGVSIPADYPTTPFSEFYAKNITIAGNTVGLAADGVTPAPNPRGIFIDRGSDSVTIGGFATADRNVVAASTEGAGIFINGGNFTDNNVTPNIEVFQATSNVTVLNNYVGTDKTGTIAISNNTHGIEFGTTSKVRIGAPTAGNLVGGNQNADGSFGTGINVFGGATDAVIQSNTLGIDSTGKNPLPNTGFGIIVGGNSANTLVGGSGAGEGNIIGFNGRDNKDYGIGIQVSGTASKAVIAGNYIGTTPSGGAAPNVSYGIELAGTPTDLLIGGPTPAHGNKVIGNGVNYGSGIRLTAAAVTVRNNVISGNKQDGIQLDGTTGAEIRDNFLGLDVTGTKDLGNNDNGLNSFNKAQNNLIIGNVASGNNGSGIRLAGGSTNNTIQGNRLGLNAAGDAVVENNFDGINLVESSTGNLIGGPNAADRNFIAGNGTGIYVGFAGNGSFANTIQGNWFGLNVAGTAVLGNRFRGLTLQAANDNTVTMNVIVGTKGSDFNDEGLVLESGSTGNKILGNLIGVGPDGRTAMGNDGRGVAVYSGAKDNSIVGNVIGANGDQGIALFDADTGSILIQGNWIGTDKTGTVNLGNKTTGVTANAVTAVTIGGSGAGQGNVIAYNTLQGVLVETTAQAAIRGNAIYENGGLGIDLGGDGVTPNDDLDPDVGANLLQNFPVLTTALAGATTNIAGVLNSLPNTEFVVDFFGSGVADAAGNGEGICYLGSTTVTTDGAGNAPITAMLAKATTPGVQITATATDPLGNTSEFSAPVVSPGGTPVQVKSLVINDGAAQRSRVLSVTLTYNQVVQLPANAADAFSLAGSKGLVGLTADTSGSTAANTVVRLTFSGAGIEAGSLYDGKFTLTNHWVAVSCGLLDGNGDGKAGDNYVSPAYGTPGPDAGTIFRLFGDGDGNGTVDFNDFLQFRGTFGLKAGDAGFNAAFDADGNGAVDFNDFLQFRSRFGTSTP